MKLGVLSPWLDPVVRDEIEQALTFVRTAWNVEHNEDDTHRKLTLTGPWRLAGAGVLVAPIIRAHRNDFNPTGWADAHTVILEGSSAFNLTGFQAPEEHSEGLVKVLLNVGASTLTLKHANAGSAAPNRFRGAGAADVTLVQHQSRVIFYVQSRRRWFAWG